MDDNGNLLSMQAGSVSQTYTYNNQNLLTSESVSIPGYGSTVNFSYGYNSMLHRESMSYPSESVSFYPNAFGEPTKVLGNTTYANNVSYHANGAIRQFDYGNGIRHNT